MFLQDKVGRNSQARTIGSAEGGAGPGSDSRAVPPRGEAGCSVAASGPSAVFATLRSLVRVGGMI